MHAGTLTDLDFNTTSQIGRPGCTFHHRRPRCHRSYQRRDRRTFFGNHSPNLVASPFRCSHPAGLPIRSPICRSRFSCVTLDGAMVRSAFLNRIRLIDRPGACACVSSAADEALRWFAAITQNAGTAPMARGLAHRIQDVPSSYRPRRSISRAVCAAPFARIFFTLGSLLTTSPAKSNPTNRQRYVAVRLVYDRGIRPSVGEAVGAPDT
ncbi:hypothetical protein BJX96DRAFT_159280 [Aspergillus floccosus]